MIEQNVQKFFKVKLKSNFKILKKNIFQNPVLKI